MQVRNIIIFVTLYSLTVLSHSSGVAQVISPPSILSAYVCPDGAVLIRGQCNNATGWYLLDTGSQTTVIDRSLCVGMSLPSVIVFANNVEATATEQDDLSHFFRRFDKQIHGLVGCNFFREYAVFIDFRTEVVLAGKTIHLDDTATDPHRELIKLDRCLDIGHYYCALAKVITGDDVLDGRVFVDSASVSDTLVSLYWLKRRGRRFGLGDVIGRTPHKWSYLDYFVFEPEVRLALTDKNPEVALGASLNTLFGGASLHYTGMIGSLYFRRRTYVLFDLGKNEIIIGSPTLSVYSTTDLISLRGALLRRNRDGSSEVAAVVPGSPAQCSGLMVKDVVETVDGVDQSRYSLDSLIWYGAVSDSPIALTLRRDGVRLGIELER